MTKFYTSAAAVGLIALVGGPLVYYTVRAPADRFEACRASAVAGGTAAIGGPFTLISETGETVTDRDVITRPTLVYFGYTFCPDVCPIDASRNAVAVDILQDDGLSAQAAFITVDPARDTPEVLRDFTANLHPDMIGLTGSDAQIEAASDAYKTYYSKQEGDPEYYLVDHSTFTYLVMPEHGFVEYFRRDDSAQAMAERTACFIAAS